MMLSVTAPSISSERYLDRLARLTRQLELIPTVTGVESLA
jgi:hypothetical protein